jgi:hypothetical protein
VTDWRGWWVGATLAVGLFAFLVWPTPWETFGAGNLRRHRVTDGLERLEHGRWVPIDRTDIPGVWSLWTGPAQ